MDVEIRRVGAEALERWGEVPISFRVESVLEAEEVDGGLGGVRLAEEPVAEPYEKDYDAHESERPKSWLRFGVSHWGFFEACDDNETVGLAAVACRSPEAHFLEGRDDVAALWDIRVRPERRGQGIGTMLFRRAVEFAREKGCRLFKIETQNTNVHACKFYARQGCRLREIRRNAYGEPDIAHETMLIWVLEL